MPQIKIERVVSFNSEDPVYVASNICGSDSKKWKCKSPGEKNASIVLQLDQPYIISGIDIGNEHSAYIEVFVARSSSPEEYKVFLVMSSFMTPFEARQSQNVNKVRMFKQEAFSEPERSEKWDQIKIVCSQPFNRHVQYGLSFIHLYTNEDKIVEKPFKLNLLGKFTFRPKSPDEIVAGSIFAKRKDQQGQTLRGAAAIREAISTAHLDSPVAKQKLVHSFPTSQQNQPSCSFKNSDSAKPRNRNELLYSKDEEDVNEKIDKLVEKKAQEKEEAKKSQRKENKKTKKEKDSFKDKRKKDIDEKESNKHSVHITVASPSNFKNKKENADEQSVLKRDNEPLKRKKKNDHDYRTKKHKDIHRKPFEALLQGVVLVISGIPNPDRASLRSVALSMGAKYKPDWDSTCTHLVCAYANTPKFTQVKGKGKIVKRNWLEDCYNKRKRLPWRRYALDKADVGEESEDEIWETENTTSIDPLQLSDSDTDMKEEGSDTEDRIRQIQVTRKNHNVNIFEEGTDDELVDVGTKTDICEIQNYALKSFFENKIFYVDKIFDKVMAKSIKQYIKAYKGLLLENLEVSIDIIITNIGNSSVFRDIYPTAVCIGPDWIWECHNCQRLVPVDDYTFT